MKNLLLMSASLGMLAMLVPQSAHAFDENEHWLSKERFQIRARAIGILPDGEGTVDGTNIETDVRNEYVPEVDFTYFFTPNISTELVVATANHDIREGNVDIGDAWILPPTLMFQYHFQPKEKFSPYVGAGVNYTFFYSEDASAGLSDLEVDGGLGLALQAGADYWLTDNWGLNFDVKYIDLNIDADVTSGTTRLRASDIDLNPFIVGAGVSYRF